MSSSSWVIENPTAGYQQIDTFDTTQNHALGERVRARHATYGVGDFVYMQFPASTAFALGILLQWDKNYLVTTVPAGGTSKGTGVALGTIVAAVSSNTSIQYGWVQVQGQVPVLKTAVAIAPQIPLYISATAGRVKAVSSTQQILIGARSANTATTTSTTSTVVVYLNNSALPGT